MQNDPSLLEPTVQPNCTVVLVIMPLCTNTVHAYLHLTNDNNETIPAADVFGNNLPAAGVHSEQRTNDRFSVCPDLARKLESSSLPERGNH